MTRKKIYAQIDKIKQLKVLATEIDMSQSILTEMKNHSNIESITKTEFDKVCEQERKVNWIR